jgi:hypothetical protein
VTDDGKNGGEDYEPEAASGVHRTSSDVNGPKTEDYGTRPLDCVNWRQNNKPQSSDFVGSIRQCRQNRRKHLPPEP